MVVVAVAGGTGDLGRVLTQAVIDTGKHQVYILSRKPPVDQKDQIIQTDYTEESLVHILSEKSVEVVICALIMDSDSACEAQLRLIRAADQCPSVKRFIPSEFNVEYDVGDEVLPYPEKRFHQIARRALERTNSVEYAYFYPGMFMDYFGMPRVSTCLRPLYFFIDPVHGRAILPGDGEGKMSMTLTTDAARYLALALDLPKWPRVLKAVASTVSLNELAALVSKSQDCPLQVTFQPVDNLLRHDSISLPSNMHLAKDYPERFPGGAEQVCALVADLEAGVALGAYDLSEVQGERLDLVEKFKGLHPPPQQIGDFIETTWQS